MPPIRSIWASRPTLWSMIAGRQPNPTDLVQHVRIRNRRRLRNVAIGAGVLYGCYSMFLTRVIPPIASHMDDEDGEPIFFPIPFSFEIVESKPYKGTDPEWQEYIRIAGDRELLVKIRTDLLETVRVAAETNPVLIHRCGNQMKVRKHWLDLEFPYRPPPKILRNGILLSHEGLEAVAMEVDHMTALRTARALFPSAVAQSASTFFTTLFRNGFHNVARYFGFEPVDDPHASMSPLATVLKKRLDEVERRSAAAKAANGNAPAVNKGQRGVITATGDASGTDLQAGKVDTRTASSTSSRPSDDAGDDLDQSVSARDLIPFGLPRGSFDEAWEEGRKKLAKTWPVLRPLPPGGCVGVSGLVELQSPNARIMIEVKAFWNPKTRSYDTQTMHMKLRTIRLRNQVPLQ